MPQHIQKGGSYARAQPKKGGLRHGHNPKRGVLGTGHVKKGGSLLWHIPVLGIYVSAPGGKSSAWDNIVKLIMKHAPESLYGIRSV